MEGKVFSHNKLIGTTHLKLVDENMGILRGEFIPNQFYYENIQEKVWQIWKLEKPNWTSLCINVQLKDGYFLFPFGGYMIEDMKEFENEIKLIDIAGLYRHEIDYFFSKSNSSNLIDGPWVYLNIDEKISIENELNLEIGKFSQNSILNLFKSKNRKHILNDYKFSALCRNFENDDILILIQKIGQDMDLAQVHLTWSGKSETTIYPKTDFYKSIEEFNLLRKNKET